MGLTAVLSGVLVSLVERPYDFTNRDTGERVAGTSLRAWVVQDEHSRPQEVKFLGFATGEFGELRKRFKFGMPVAMRVEPGPRDTPDTHTFQEFVPLPRADQPAS